jgi:hypothetical protein
MHRGYLKLWRKTKDSGMNAIQLGFWSYCLLEAAYKPTKRMIGNQTIELQPGQFIFGRKMWAKVLGLSEKQIRNCVRIASDMRSKNGRIRAIKRASKYTVYEIINWTTYQQNDSCEGQQHGQQQGQQQGQQGASKGPHSKNSKNSKEIKPTCGSLKKSYPYPDWLDRKQWDIFWAMRSRIKKPITTEETIKRLINLLKKLMDEGHSQEQLFANAIDNCWQKFYPPKGNPAITDEPPKLKPITGNPYAD